ncbi:glycosyltransferase [Lacisediminimonas profundi]|uniref:glycosyltransferase n=1 Tax=Lacisediminimonas profundi TaxID=2603856 RepID=UPI00124BC123|nr:glycosyltransferase [Lacisediminimonas profundi]
MLDLDFFDAENTRPVDFSGDKDKYLFLSANPDLKTDFGHFLNYERRMKDVCDGLGINYLCLAHKDCELNFDWSIPIFEHDSGFYSLYRGSVKVADNEIAQQFLDSVHRGIELFQSKCNKEFEKVVVFFYTGSSKFAGKLANQLDSELIKHKFIINSFWDFIAPSSYQPQSSLSRIKFSKQVELFAMSSLHSISILETTGLCFAPIVNPPPLMSDGNSILSVKRWRATRLAGEFRSVFLPGLMTIGKGLDFTSKFFETASIRESDFHFIVRDRKSEVNLPLRSNIEVLRGDFSNEEIICFYSRSDAVVLPYDSKVFSVRTSGALVDCLLLGAVPIVFSGTWLASICENFDFGHIVSGGSVDEVAETINLIASDIDRERNRLYSGAIKYLCANTWTKLVESVILGPESQTLNFHLVGGDTYRSDKTRQLPPDDENFSRLWSSINGTQFNIREANSRFNEGDVRVAMTMYLQLHEQRGLQMYLDNALRCARKLGIGRSVTKEKLLSLYVDEDA